MADTTLPGVLLKGVAASRPAATAVAKGTIYSATDTGAISQSDAATWSTYATISGMSDPMTTRGDIIVRNSSNATARLAVGSAGKFFGTDGTDPTWQALAFGQVTRTAGDLTTTSGSFTDVTGATVTLTTGARRCRVTVTGSGGIGTNGEFMAFDVDVDGTRIGNASTYGLVLRGAATANNNDNLSFSVLTSVLSAASHTIKLQFRTSAGATGTIRASTGVTAFVYAVEETLLTT